MALLLTSCEQANETTGEDPKAWSRLNGTIEVDGLDEASGMQASRRHADVHWLINDSGPPVLYAVDGSARHLGQLTISNAVNIDWEDIALVPGTHRDRLVIADIGDNHASRSRIQLYIVNEPEPDAEGRFAGRVELSQWISIFYPDGPRDSESLAYDPRSGQLLILSKRDVPPRLYALDLQQDLGQGDLELEFVGTTQSFRQPDLADRIVFGKKAPWVAQPTALDIAPDGLHAVVLSYRSLFFFELGEASDWRSGLLTVPMEIPGPPPTTDEAVSFNADASAILVTAEGARAPLYEFRLEALSGSAPDPSATGEAAASEN